MWSLHGGPIISQFIGLKTCKNDCSRSNHLIPWYYHLIQSLYGTLLLTYKAVVSLSTHSYFTHLPFFCYVFSFPSIFLSGYKEGFVFMALNAPRSGARHASCYVIVSERERKRKAAFDVMVAFSRQRERRATHYNAETNSARCVIVGQAGRRTERICIGAREEGGHCGQPKQRERGEWTEENWIGESHGPRSIAHSRLLLYTY